MRYKTILAATLLCTATYAGAAVGIYIGEPRVSIRINFPVYPEFVRVPNYPVYYAPHVDTNIFFYDGLYWVFDGERWYASSWYNGPWGEVAPEAVPLYVLRVPVRYYRHAPSYFRAWAYDAPPRWDVFWGSTWASHRSGWDRWNRSYVPAAAPLPLYQRQYSGSRYPTTIEQQQVLQSRQYRYQPRDTVVQQYYRQNVVTAPVTTRAQQSTVTTTTQSTVTTRAQQGARVQSAQAYAPGQLRNEQGAQSAREFAPGQVKKQQGVQSAREFAPGQVKKNQVAQAPQAVAPQVVEQRAAPPANAHPNRGRGNREAVENEGENNGNGNGRGQGQGHGRGHGRD